MIGTNGEKTNVSTLIIENNRLFREGLKYLLAGSQFEIRRETASLKDAADVLDSGFIPDLIILDFLTGDAQAISDIRRLRSNLMSARIVVLTYALSGKKLAQALEAGADSYLLSDMSPAALIQSLALTMLGEKVFPTNLAKLLIDGHIEFSSDRSFASGTLSDREIQILCCLAHGDPNKTIANRLSITEATVKVHLKGLLRKINVCNRTQAAIWAVEQGIDKVPKTLDAWRGPISPARSHLRACPS